MDTDTQHNAMLEELKMLNAQVQKQNSMKEIFTKGIIYGVGFFIGSAVLATIALGMLSPWVGKIDWIRDSFERGASLEKTGAENL